MVEISDFILKGPFVFPAIGRTLDMKRIVELPEEDFREFYLKLMNEYRDNDGWWSNGKIPHCSECHVEISEPKQLRRYYGMSLHPHCFLKVYKEDTTERDRVTRRYWDRVSSLEL